MFDLSAAWFVRSRQLARDFRFWLALVGIRPGDPSLSFRIYVVYAVIFFAIWGFLVLSLFADGAVRVVTSISPNAPELAAVALNALAVVVWILASLLGAARRSPLRFTEEDHFLICQTPLDRSAVTLTWFVGDLPRWGLPFWAGSIVLGFALAEIKTHNAGFSALPQYVLAGSRAVSILLVLHAGLTAWLWAFSLLRLQQERAFPGLVRLAVPFALLVGASLVWTVMRTGLVGLNASLLFWPVIYPLQAAYGRIAWWAGLALAVGLAAAGGAVLGWVGQQVSLSRAAQESTRQVGAENALLAGEMEAAADLSLQNRLGEQHHPSHLAGRPGAWIIVWKDILQSRRSLSFANGFNWIAIFGLVVSALLIPDLGARILVGVYAYSLLCQQFTLRLRADLSRWWLLQSLPLSKPDLLVAELVLPWGLTTALGWLAVLAVGTGPFFPGAILVVLLPPITATLAFIAAADLLRQSKTALLMRGLPARTSELSLIVGALCAAAPFGLLWFNRTTLLLGGVLAFAAACLLAYLAFQVAVYFYQNIE